MKKCMLLILALLLFSCTTKNVSPIAEENISDMKLMPYDVAYKIAFKHLGDWIDNPVVYVWQEVYKGTGPIAPTYKVDKKDQRQTRLATITDFIYQRSPQWLELSTESIKGNLGGFSGVTFAVSLTDKEAIELVYALNSLGSNISVATIQNCNPAYYVWNFACFSEPYNLLVR